MNIVRLWGGLGNQLFQYSFARCLEKRHGYDTFVFHRGAGDEGIRCLIKDLKDISANDRMVPAYWKTEVTLKHKIIRKIYQKLSILNNKIVVEDDLWFKDRLPADNTLYDGYWQSYKYLTSIEKELRSEIIFNPSIIDGIPSYKDVQETQSVSIHIRRGDYLNEKNKNIFCNCDFNYYEAAIKLLTSEYRDLAFFIFSNDIQWVKESFDFSQFTNSSFSYISNNAPVNAALRDLYIMSNCKHNIIANSTFSWWGAWLNQNIGKVVIAPKNWYVGVRNKYVNDLIPPSWMKI